MSASPHISPGFVARPARCWAQRSFRPRGSAGAPSAVRRSGSCAEVEARGGVDARASSTTRNEEIGHDPNRPIGLRRHGPVFFVAAPRRWRDIAVVAAPRIRGHGARNGRYWGLRPDLARRGVVLDSTLRRAFGACVSPPSARFRWARLGASLRPLCAAVGGESTPRRDNTAGCGASTAVAGSW